MAWETGFWVVAAVVGIVLAVFAEAARVPLLCQQWTRAARVNKRSIRAASASELLVRVRLRRILAPPIDPVIAHVAH